MKMKVKMKNGSHEFDINRPSSRHGHKYTIYKMCLSIMMVWLYVLSNTQATFEAQFMKKLSNTQAALKKALLVKKACI